ncbi:hypothetical protein BT63DRAFT_424766 [Microthyrium microscopicum]|uniref:Maintenance of mitochondrial morphology protein 1 n=1 Tax=Microthyrium microscopicum TaxID=703497 RepID=A0A6A6UD63_9PEZI|nr:hypothetical protein BT63DRAFT_424766 [Microthyrium microscopicum]
MNALTAFFLGQLSLAILIFAFIKFFIFGDPPTSPRPRRHSHTLLRPPRSLRNKRSAILRSNAAALHLPPSTILSKTFYNVSGHQPESLDWFNVLVAQTLAQLRADALHDDAMLNSLSAVLNGPTKPDFLGAINVTELSLGDEFPIFSNCRIIPVDDAGAQVQRVGDGTRLLARLDVDLSDALTLGIETKMLLNYPLALAAVLPVALAVSVVRFSATLSLSFIPTANPTPAAPKTTLAFSFLPDYRLDLSVRSLLGSRARLQDVPKLAQLVESRIHAWLHERCVEPRFQQIVLPSLWPRKQNTRGGDDEDEEGASETGGEDTEREDGRQEGKQTSAGAQRERPVTGSELEQRMAEEGRKLRQAEARMRGQTNVAGEVGSAHSTSASAMATARRRPQAKTVESTDNLRMPGHFE